MRQPRRACVRRLGGGQCGLRLRRRRQVTGTPIRSYCCDRDFQLRCRHQRAGRRRQRAEAGDRYNQLKKDDDQLRLRWRGKRRSRVAPRPIGDFHGTKDATSRVKGAPGAGTPTRATAYAVRRGGRRGRPPGRTGRWARRRRHQRQADEKFAARTGATPLTISKPFAGRVVSAGAPAASRRCRRWRGERATPRWPTVKGDPAERASLGQPKGAEECHWRGPRGGVAPASGAVT